MGRANARPGRISYATSEHVTHVRLCQDDIRKSSTMSIRKPQIVHLLPRSRTRFRGVSGVMLEQLKQNAIETYLTLHSGGLSARTSLRPRTRIPSRSHCRAAPVPVKGRSRRHAPITLTNKIIMSCGTGRAAQCATSFLMRHQTSTCLPMQPVGRQVCPRVRQPLQNIQ